MAARGRRNGSPSGERSRRTPRCRARVRAMGIRDRPTSFRSPWQNGYDERLIGSVRRECTDHLIAFNADYLRRILAKYAIYYIEMRTHVSLGKDAPCTRPIERFGDANLGDGEPRGSHLGIAANHRHAGRLRTKQKCAEPAVAKAPVI